MLFVFCFDSGWLEVGVDEEYGFGRKTILDTAAKSKADIVLDACLKQRRMEGSKTEY